VQRQPTGAWETIAALDFLPKKQEQPAYPTHSRGAPPPTMQHSSTTKRNTLLLLYIQLLQSQIARDGSRNLFLGVQIPSNTNRKGEKLKMIHASWATFSHPSICEFKVSSESGTGNANQIC
jgi:hypothetical protein